MFCENCGTQLEDGALFCPECGARLAEAEQPIPMPTAQEDDEKTVMVRVAPQDQSEDTVIPSKVETPSQPEEPVYDAPVQNIEDASPAQGTVFCPQCGAANNSQDAFCLSCGAALNGAAPAPGQVNPNVGPAPVNDSGFVVQDINNIAQKKQKTPGQGKKVLKIVLIVVAALIVLVGAVFAVKLILGGSGNKKARTDILYIKDDSLFSTSLKKIKPVELDDEAFDDEYHYAYELNPTYSSDGRYLFYYQLGDNQYSETYDLYYMDVKAKDPSPEKFASDMEYRYYMTEDDRIIFEKNDSLYIQDMKENKEKIANDLGDYWVVSEDEKQILWLDQEGTIYVQDLALKEDKVKVDSDVQNVYFTSDDLYFTVYAKEDKLYLNTNMEEKEKISQEDFEYVGAAVDGKNIQIAYGERSEEDEDVTLYDLVDDSASASEGYDEYSLEWTRDDLKNYTIGRTCELKLYDSATGEKTVVAEGMINDAFEIGEIDGKLAMAYGISEEDNLPHWAIGKVYDEGVYSYADEVERAKGNGSLYVAVGTDTTEALEAERSYHSINMEEDGKDIYIVSCEEQWDEENYTSEHENYELGKITYGSKGFGSYEKIYDDVNVLLSVEKGDLVYGIYEDDTEETVELYKNDDKIDTDVAPYTVARHDDGNISYYKDMDDDGMGTLKVYTGKESTKIANDVKRAVYVNEKLIPVLVDYDVNHGTGDLKLYNGKELETIDTDVYYMFYIE